MNKIIILFIVAFQIFAACGQVNDLTDTIVRKNDIYNNFKQPKQAGIYSGTVAIDSLKTLQAASGEMRVISLNYLNATMRADKFLMNADYSQAASLYLLAFKNNNGMGQVRHRYALAKCYAKLGKVDSLFIQLFRIAEKGNYYNCTQLENEPFFIPVQKDKRWLPLIKIVKENATRIQNKLNLEIPKNK